MPTHRKVFFSFHYDRDAWRAGQVRNSGLLQKGDEVVGRFQDKAEWESLKRTGDAAVLRWINAQLIGTSVTVVLIGQETASRRWVHEEILASRRKGNGMLGVRVHGIVKYAGTQQSIDQPGLDPFAAIQDPLRPGHTLAGLYPTYNWSTGSGLLLPDWIEGAAQKAGR